MSGKVVRVERTPAYMHHRAMLQWQRGSMVDALELMRRAVEGEPENHIWRLELAELYHQTGCYEESTRLLLDVFVEHPDASQDCLLGLIMNQLALRNMSQATKLLKMYVEGAVKEGAQLRHVAPEVDIRFAAPPGREKDRRRARAERLTRMGMHALSREEGVRAQRLLIRSLGADGSSGENHALLAAASLMEGDREEARRQCARAAEDGPNVKTACLISHLYRMMGEEDEARAVLLAHENDGDDEELPALAIAFGVSGLHDRALACAGKALEAAPYDRRMLHVSAAAMWKTGIEPEKACRPWQRIARIDPADSVAKYYLDAQREGELSAERVSYLYELPADEVLRRSRSLCEVLEETPGDRLEQRWRADGSFRELVYWAVSGNAEILQRVAATVLASVNDGEAVSRMRAALFNDSLAEMSRMNAAIALGMRGIAIRSLLPGELCEAPSDGEGADEIMERFPVNDRALVNYTAELSEARASEKAEMAKRWQAYREGRGLRFDAITRPECGAVVLMDYSLKRRDRKRLLCGLSVELHCSPRRMRYYAVRMDRILAKREERQ
ncbi:MAG: hypothetical protein IJH78_03065 [Clostridia bacterium]|nr:hypothetical protein [Clostridia bacterium]